MNRVVVGIGSNTADRDKRMAAAVDYFSAAVELIITPPEIFALHVNGAYDFVVPENDIHVYRHGSRELHLRSTPVVDFVLLQLVGYFFDRPVGKALGHTVKIGCVTPAPARIFQEGL